MRRNYLLASIIVGCLLFLNSCQKDHGTSPKIEFLTPFDSQTLDLQKTVSVELNIWDDKEVVSYIILLKSTSGLEYFREEKTIKKEICNILYNFDLSTTKNQNFNITIWARDNDGNTTKSTILINVDD